MSVERWFKFRSGVWMCLAFGGADDADIDFDDLPAVLAGPGPAAGGAPAPPAPPPALPPAPPPAAPPAPPAPPAADAADAARDAARGAAARLRQRRYKQAWKRVSAMIHEEGDGEWERAHLIRKCPDKASVVTALHSRFYLLGFGQQALKDAAVYRNSGNAQAARAARAASAERYARLYGGVGAGRKAAPP